MMTVLIIVLMGVGLYFVVTGSSVVSGMAMIGIPVVYVAYSFRAAKNGARNAFLLGWYSRLDDLPRYSRTP